jgi:hypothetical protein
LAKKTTIREELEIKKGKIWWRETEINLRFTWRKTFSNNDRWTVSDKIRRNTLREERRGTSQHSLPLWY